MSLGNETSEKYQASMHLHLRAAEDKHGDSVSALCWRGRDRALPLGTRRGLYDLTISYKEEAVSHLSL